MPIIDCQQGTPEWFDARLGVPTASNFSKVLAGGKGLTRKSYMMQLVAEIITGQRAESYSNAAMDWGTEHEPEARAMYAFRNDAEVIETGFHKLDCNAGCSLDGIVGNDGTIEIKMPNTTTHIETVLSGKMPTKHISQVQGGLWITDRKWCDFISYDPRVKTDKDYFCVRIMRDDDYIENLKNEVAIFNRDINKILIELNYKEAA